MAGVVQDWRADLVLAYPDLFHPVGNPPAAQGWPEVGDGWSDLLQRACARIQRAIRADGGTFQAAQIKEKYGSLRFYWNGALSPGAKGRVEEAVALAEARSACTCEVCGDEGRLYEEGHLLMTRCTAHAQGLPVESRPGFDNIQIVQRVVDGRLRIVQCRRYDRETDSFVDIDPRVVDIEEEPQ